MSLRPKNRQGLRGELSQSVDDLMGTEQLISTIIFARRENLILTSHKWAKMVRGVVVKAPNEEIIYKDIHLVEEPVETPDIQVDESKTEIKSIK